MTCLRLGQDLSVTLSGGDREHIGAVALAHPGAESPSALALEGHREEALATEIASGISSRLQVTVCVACGIHVDGLRPEELKDILEMSQELTGELLDRLKP
jgi:gallate decarboxylase subunit D